MKNEKKKTSKNRVKSNRSENEARRISNLAKISSSEEARKKGSKGGKKSGEIRREKRALKDIAKSYMEMPVGSIAAIERAFKNMGVPIEANTTLKDALFMLGMYKSALGGNMNAVQMILKLLGEDEEAVDKKIDITLKIEDLSGVEEIGDFEDDD